VPAARLFPAIAAVADDEDTLAAEKWSRWGIFFPSLDPEYVIRD